MNNMNQKGFVNIILIVTVIVLSGATGYSVLAKSSGAADVPPATLTIGENITVTGIVVGNSIHSPVDGADVLTLDTDYGEIDVFYNVGRVYNPDTGKIGSGCVNMKPAEKGIRLEAGDKAEVYGKVIGENYLSTCDSKEFYVR
jgi:hypothetical protein